MSRKELFNRILIGLNNNQQMAVFSPLKPILVVAGAGTGKTTVLTRRFQYLVEKEGIKPENILVVTFTRKSANCIKKRIEKLIPDLIKKEKGWNFLNVSTFHTFGKNFLLKEYKREFAICQEHVSKRLVQGI